MKWKKYLKKNNKINNKEDNKKNNKENNNIIYENIKLLEKYIQYTIEFIIDKPYDFKECILHLENNIKPNLENYTKKHNTKSNRLFYNLNGVYNLVRFMEKKVI